MSTLRIRPDNATIRELKIPKEILEVLQKVVSSPQTTDDVKKMMIKKFAQVSPCCICGGIPSLEVLYDCDGISRIERYCENCANRVFSRNAVI
jgi:carbamate kinase